MADKRVCLALQLVKSQSNKVPTDAQGNWILWAEASNENLDFDGQVVLQDALKKSETYFLQNGVISYDHRHLQADPSDPAWTPEKYIIGEPLAVKTKGKRTFVQFKLYKSSKLAQDIVGKIESGSTRVKTSIAGKMPEIVQEFSQRVGQAVEFVKGVLWDELALTFKPVNQTLAPITPDQFVKSLMATPMPTDVAQRTGGAALIGTGRKPKKKARHKPGVKNHEEKEEEENMDPKALTKSVDDAVTELTKALGRGGRGRGASAPEPEPELPEDDFDDEDDDDGEDDPENEDLDGDYDDGGNDPVEPQPAPARGKRTRKSIESGLREDGYGDALDASPILMALTKSMDELRRSQTEIMAFQKSLGKVIVAQTNLTKSLATSPAPRAGVLGTVPRAIGGQPVAPAAQGNIPQWSEGEILQKAIKAREAGKLSSVEFTMLSRRVKAGEALPQAGYDLLKSF